MNCISLPISKLKPSLKKLLINDFEEAHLKSQMTLSYGRYESDDKKSLAYIKNLKEYTDMSGPTGGVSFYRVNLDLVEMIKEHCNADPFLMSCSYFYQLVSGGNYVAPHTDDRRQRTVSILYILDPGNINTKTIFWKPKSQFLKLRKDDGVAIPEYKLDKTEEYVLEKDHWYKMNFNEIHSVENLSGRRLMIAAIPPK